MLREVSNIFRRLCFCCLLPFFAAAAAAADFAACLLLLILLIAAELFGVLVLSCETIHDYYYDL